MTEQEYRALIGYHAKELLDLNREPKDGYGITRKISIVERLRRMLQLAENLE